MTRREPGLATKTRPIPRRRPEPSGPTDNGRPIPRQPLPICALAKTAGRSDAQAETKNAASKSAAKGDSRAGSDSAKGKNERADTGKDAEGGSDRPSGNGKPGDRMADQSKQASPGSPEPKASPTATSLALADAKKNQQAIADELQKMLDSMGEFETYRGVVKDVQELVKQQEQTIKQTAEAASRPEMMGKSKDALSPEQQSELGNLAARQSQLGKALQNLQERMGEIARRLDESDPLAASAMREASAKSQKQGTVGKMGEAADQLENNQMGQARPRRIRHATSCVICSTLSRTAVNASWRGWSKS